MTIPMNLSSQPSAWLHPKTPLYSWFVALGLIMMYVGLSEIQHQPPMDGYHIMFIPSWTNSSPGELRFWLGYHLLLVPACLILGTKLMPYLAMGIRSSLSHPALGRLGPLVVFAFSFALFVWGRKYFLRDFPVTDDEYGLDFCGQLFALGKQKIPWGNTSILPSHLIWAKQGEAACYDWPGTLWIEALEHLTMTGTLLHQMIAALGTMFMYLAARKTWGEPYGVAMAILCTCTPLAFFMNITGHTQLISRAVVCVLVFLLATRSEQASMKWHVVFGLLLGYGFLVRPFEFAFLSWPMLIWVAHQAGFFRKVSCKKSILPLTSMMLAMATMGILMLYHNQSITGNPLLPARFDGAGGLMEHAPGTIHTHLFHRFGENSVYNAFMLGIFFLGLPGLLLFVVGARANALTATLALSILSLLGLGLFHSNYGLHSVGPIHYAEALGPLAWISMAGVVKIQKKLEAWKLPSNLFIHALSGLLICTLIFIATHGNALRASNHYQEVAHQSTYGSGLQKSIILAPRMMNWALSLPEFQRIPRGSFVFEWPAPKPPFDGPVIVLHDVPNAAEYARHAFPGRMIYRLPLGSRSLIAVEP